MILITSYASSRGWALKALVYRSEQLVELPMPWSMSVNARIVLVFGATIPRLVTIQSVSQVLIDIDCLVNDQKFHNVDNTYDSEVGTLTPILYTSFFLPTPD